MGYIMTKFKLVLVVVCILAAGCSASAHDNTRPWLVLILSQLDADHNGPAEFIVYNQSTAMYAMTELRAVGDVCAHDLGVTGSGYNEPEGGLMPQEGFLVSESTCNNMHLKANRGNIKLTTYDPLGPGGSPITVQIEQGRIILPETTCPAPLPAAGVALCADASGQIWVSSKTGVRAL
jgi:hypothetical protein